MLNSFLYLFHAERIEEGAITCIHFSSYYLSKGDTLGDKEALQLSLYVISC